MVIGSYISIITLNVNGLNAPMKRHRLTKWIQEQEPYICCLQETHLRPRDTYKLKLRCWEKIFQPNRNQKKMGVAIFTADKIDVKNHYRRQGRTVHNYQGFNPRRCNNYKCICTQNWRTSMHKANANNY